MIEQKQILIAQEDFNTFLAFKAHREKFLVLLKAGVYELDSGKVEIDINNNQVQKIHIHRLTYKRDVNMV